MKKFKTLIDGTGTMHAPRRINYLRNMLCGEDLGEFDELASQVSGTKNAHLKFIKEVLIGYFPNQCLIRAEARDVPRNM